MVIRIKYHRQQELYRELRTISILEVARSLNLNFVRTGCKTYNMREAQEITSLTLFTDTNTFHRFSGKKQGGVSRGSVIDLVMHIRGFSFHEAVNFLISHFPLCG